MIRMPSPLPDWARCINCKNSARQGVITHDRTCPDYRRPDLTKAKSVRFSDLIGKR